MTPSIAGSMPSEREIESCIKALQWIAKSKHVIDEVRGAVWEFYLSNPKQKCSPHNPRLRKFLSVTLQLSSSFTDISDTQTSSEGDEYSIIDIVTSDDRTPEKLLSEQHESEPEIDAEAYSAKARERFLSRRHLITWRQEQFLRMQVEGYSCTEMSIYSGLTVKSVYQDMTDARNAIRDHELLQKGIPSTAVIKLRPLCVGSLTNKRSKR